MKRVPVLNFEQTINGVFRKHLFKHRYEADQQASPRSSPKQLTVLECKNHKDVKKLQLFGRAMGSFQERGTFGSWNVDRQLEEYESVVYGEIGSGITPAVIATVYKLKLLKNSRKDNSFSKKTVGYLNYYLHAL